MFLIVVIVFVGISLGQKQQIIVKKNLYSYLHGNLYKYNNTNTLPICSNQTTRTDVKCYCTRRSIEILFSFFSKAYDFLCSLLIYNKKKSIQTQVSESVCWLLLFNRLLFLSQNISYSQSFSHYDSLSAVTTPLDCHCIMTIERIKWSTPKKKKSKNRNKHTKNFMSAFEPL